MVTGSSRGIGLGIARIFAERGNRVVLNGCTDAERLNEAVAELKANAVAVMGVLGDFSDYETARSIFAEIRRQFGPVEVLVNNAGASHFGLFSDMSPSEWDWVLRQNLGCTLNASHLAVPDMVRAKRGVIVNISSIWGVTGASCEAVYAAAKAGINGFTRSLAKELGPSNVRVNAVACGIVETRMNERLSPEDRNAFAENIPLMRFGLPEEVGRLVYFLASDAAAYLTGQIIPLDGGYTA